jgi:hypothetical protein
MAELFETRVYTQGKFNTRNLSAGFSEFSTPLTGELDVHAVSPASYGHLLLYFWYLYLRCGGEDLFWNLVVSAPDVFGEKTIEGALRKSGSKKIGCSSFAESVAESELARTLNTRSIQGDDPDRWFLLFSALGPARARDPLPSAEVWAKAEPWTPFLVPVPDELKSWKVPPGGRAWWIKAGAIPKVSESAARPDPTYRLLLILKGESLPTGGPTKRGSSGKKSDST